MKDKATKLNDTSHLIEYYNNYDEEGRLLSRHGQIEYLTTMKYIEDALGGNKRKRILEAGAGTGRYSVTLAQMGIRWMRWNWWSTIWRSFVPSSPEGKTSLRCREMYWICPVMKTTLLT